MSIVSLPPRGRSEASLIAGLGLCGCGCPTPSPSPFLVFIHPQKQSPRLGPAVLKTLSGRHAVSVSHSQNDKNHNNRYDGSVYLAVPVSCPWSGGLARVILTRQPEAITFLHPTSPPLFLHPTSPPPFLALSTRPGSQCTSKKHLLFRPLPT